MPEALAIFAVFIVAVAAYVSARIQAQNPASQDPQQEALRLRHHDAWLRDRLKLARQENWGVEMVESIVTELETTSQRIEAVKSASMQR